MINYTRSEPFTASGWIKALQAGESLPRSDPMQQWLPGSATQQGGHRAQLVSPHRPSKAAPRTPRAAEALLQKTHTHKSKKKPEKWRQAGVSNPKVLVFIQTRAWHCSVPNAPKPFCLREIHIWPRPWEGRQVEPEPALPTCL